MGEARLGHGDLQDPRWVTAAAVVIAGVAAASAIRLLLLVVAHAGRPVYQLPAIAVITASAAGAVATGAALVMAVRPRRGLALLSSLTAGLFALVVLGMFSIGILVLPLALGSLVLLVKRASAAAGAALVPLVSGAALTGGLLVVTVVASHPPMVSCLPGGGVSTTASSWWGGGPSRATGSGVARPDGEASGTISMGDRDFTYRCRQGQLVEFGTPSR